MIPRPDYKDFIILSILSLLLLTPGCREKTDQTTLGNNIVCYSASYNKGVYKSDNGGISWYPLVADQEDIYLYSKRLFLDPNEKRLYITTTGNGLFSIDMDRDILTKIDEFKDEDVRSVVFKPSSSGPGSPSDILVAKKETGIYRLPEGAGIWEPFNQGLTYRDVNVLFEKDNNLFAGTINGIFRWDDASCMWQDISEGIKNKNILAIYADPEGKTIYVGSGAYQDKKGRFERIPTLYKSVDSGKTWEQIDRGIPGDTLVFSIAENPINPERLYLGTSEGIYRSTDNGNKWYKISNGLPDKFKALDIKIIHLSDGNDVIYAAGVYGIFIAFDVKRPEWEERDYGIDETYISSILFPDIRQSTQH